MKLLRRYEELLLANVKSKLSGCVLVPTMGALHEGHGELIRRGRELADQRGVKLVVSIFVNPLQFDRVEDLTGYPVDLERDLELCEKRGVDVVFAPEGEFGFYPKGFSLRVEEDQLSKRLCGATRGGHFSGVCTVLARLFQLTACGVGVFGEKDYQQISVVRRMVRDLAMAVDIEGVPTVREGDGLAMSSRNRRLSDGQRADASRIWRALQGAASLGACGEEGADRYLAAARSYLMEEAREDFTIDYLELLDAENLESVSVVRGAVVLAVACFYEEVRLIDNIVFRRA